jgi:hypothetical protein
MSLRNIQICLESRCSYKVVDLAQRKPEYLSEKMAEVNLAKKLVRRLPSLRNVEDWVNKAKKLPCGIS